MAQKPPRDKYKVNTDVSQSCKDVFHRELNLRRLGGEPDLRVKDVTAEWLERMAEQRAPELQALAQKLSASMQE